MKPRKVLLVGGGTAGSVMPLIALNDEMHHRSKGKTKVLFVGSKKGIEKGIAEHNRIPYTAISSGKIRRYFDVRNFIDPFLVITGFFQSLFLLRRFKPDVVLTAGSFISAPVSWAAKILGIPFFIHQQDIRKTLSNSLAAFAATKITIALKPSAEYYATEKTAHIGNPLRSSVLGGKREKAYELFGLRKDLPVVLVIGGGTGALSLNEKINEALPELARFAQVVHLTGKGKKIGSKKRNYFPFEFLRDELKHMYAVADIVISRAGMSTITELAALKKSAIIVPLPGTHQEDNAKYFEEEDACILLEQDKMTSENISKIVKDLILDPEKKRTLGEKLHSLFPDKATKSYVDLIESTLDDIYVQKHS